MAEQLDPAAYLSYSFVGACLGDNSRFK